MQWTRGTRIFAGLLAALAVPGGAPAMQASQGGRPAADVVFQGGVVHTMDPGRTRAAALAVREGLIVAIGDAAAVEPWIGDGTEIVDMAGGMLLPAFQDAHVHPLAGGMELGDCDLNGSASREEVLDRIRACHEALPAGAWLRGGGFDLPLFPGGNPRAETLDEIVGERPALVTSADGHNAWVSSRALEIAGIDASTPDPPAGRIERDDDGAPTGTLRETAVDLVARHLPRRTPEARREGLRRGLALSARLGITAMQEASANEADLRAYDELERRGELSARMSISLYVNPERGLEQVPDLVRLRERYDREGLRVETVKIFADGVLEGQTAAVLEPYTHREGYRGEANFERRELIALIVALDAVGFQVHVHAIGDRGIRDTLDGFEEARRRNGARDSRHHIAHAQLIHPDDVPRFGRLHAYANFSPLWAQADTYVTELTDPFIGPERARWQYPLGDIVATGGRFACGSDWSVSSMDPLQGIQVGVTRVPLRAPANVEPWLPEQRVDLDAMLACYTINAAAVNFLDDTTGSLEVGKAADLVLLDRDLSELPPRRIAEARVLRTYLGGELLYER